MNKSNAGQYDSICGRLDHFCVEGTWRGQLALVLLACFSVFGCKRAETNGTKWTSPTGIWAVFRRDKTFSQGIEGQKGEFFKGNWTLTQNRYIVYIADMADKPVPDSMANVAIVFDLSADGRTLTEKSGDNLIKFTKESGN